MQEMQPGRLQGQIMQGALRRRCMLQSLSLENLLLGLPTSKKNQDFPLAVVSEFGLLLTF